jgi:hypothetical protein
VVLIKKKKNNLFEWLDNPSQELSILDNQELARKIQPIVEKPVEKQEVKPLPRQITIPKAGPKSISIKDAIEGRASTSTQIDEAPDNDVEDELNDEDIEFEFSTDQPQPFTQVDIETQWQQFIQEFLSGKPRYASLLSNYQPIVGENYKITIEFESQLQVEMFSEVKNDLLLFLRKNFNSKTITFETIVLAQDSSKNKLYTVEDKFKYLSELNPTLIKLKQQLNLDFD